MNASIVKVGATVLAVIASTSCAVALTITPASSPQWSGTSPVNPDASDISSITGNTVTEKYKQDVGQPDSGTFSSSYHTTFDTTATDPLNAHIFYDGGATITGNPLYLLVKDGQQVAPFWYIFDISGWNRTETIDILGFWPEQGSISHVAIYGGSTVPDGGSTIAMLGAGLMFLAGIARRGLSFGAA